MKRGLKVTVARSRGSVAGGCRDYPDEKGTERAGVKPAMRALYGDAGITPMKRGLKAAEWFPYVDTFYGMQGLPR